jgi:hypothetical protein
VGPLIVLWGTQFLSVLPPASSSARMLSAMDTSLFRESLTNAIRYWEKMRVVYNSVLLLVVAGCFAWNYSAVGSKLSVNLFLSIIFCAILLNVVYCAAYIVDVAVQMSEFRERWANYRWVLLSIGVMFAAILTRFWSLSVFGPV